MLISIDEKALLRQCHIMFGQRVKVGEGLFNV